MAKRGPKGRAVTLDWLFNNCQPVPFSGCWIWMKSIGTNGYGKTWHNNKTALAHRVAWIITEGEISNELELDHLCRVRSCINPQHLEPVTPKENLSRSPLIGLRGAPVHHRNKTHCPKGHPYSGENLYLSPKSGGRVCKICKSESGKSEKRQEYVKANREKRKIYDREYARKRRAKVASKGLDEIRDFR
jgi:hypothetical protein